MRHSGTRRVGGFAIVVLLAASQPTGSAGQSPFSTFFVPQFGHGALNGNRFSSDITLINLSTTTSTFEIMTFDDDGDPSNLLDSNGMATNRIQSSIPGRGTVSLRSLNSDPQNAIGLGYATIDTPNAIGVQVLFNIIDAQGNLTSTDVRVGPIITAASTVGTVSNSAQTGLALLNPEGNNLDALITILLLNSSGQQVAQINQTLGPGEKLSRFLNELFSGIGSFNGSVEFRSTQAIAILPLRQEGIVLTTQSLFPPRQIP